MPHLSYTITRWLLCSKSNLITYLVDWSGAPRPLLFMHWADHPGLQSEFPIKLALDLTFTSLGPTPRGNRNAWLLLKTLNGKDAQTDTRYLTDEIETRLKWGSEQFADLSYLPETIESISSSTSPLSNRMRSVYSIYYISLSQTKDLREHRWPEDNTTKGFCFGWNHFYLDALCTMHTYIWSVAAGRNE